MSTDFPSPESCPGAIEALRWLLQLPSGAGPSWVLRQARLHLISAELGGYWRVKTEEAERLMRVPPAIPQDRRRFTKILHGLGELSARSHCDFLSPIIPQIRRFLRRNSPARLLDAAATIQLRHGKPYSLAELGRAQMVVRTKLEWETYRACEWFLWHPGSYSAPGRYGFKFIAKLVAKLFPHELGIWLVRRGEHPSVSPVLSTLVDGLAFRPQSERARALLSMPVPLLQCVGAAALIWPDGPHEWSKYHFKDVFQDLIAGGIPPGDALWMTASRLKDCFHRRFRLEGRILELEQDIARLERFPDTAPGGSENASEFIVRHRSELAEAKQELPRLLDWTDSQLDQMAASWPAIGLTDAQHVSLEPIFIDHAELRYRVATRLAPGGDRDILLRCTIDHWVAAVEKGEPYLWREDNETTLAWTARSFVLLHAGQPHMGRNAGRLLGRLIAKPKILAYQPYASVRRPDQWREATGQIASAVLFAFAVIEAAPDQCRQEMAVLREHAIDIAFQLLANAGRWWRDEDGRLDHVARSSLWHMAATPPLSPRIRIWAEAEELPDFPRALAAWCVREPDGDVCFLAEHLLLRVARLPMSENSLSAGFHRLLNLLDVACACRTGNSRTLLRLWPQAYAPWDEVTRGRWRDAARWLAAAVEENGSERRELLSAPEFTQSFCRSAIEGAWPGNNNS